MGLLDDAIREHLELKRRRGGDPGEIERAERDALGPVRRMPEPGDEPPYDGPYDSHDAEMLDEELGVAYGEETDLPAHDETMPRPHRAGNVDEDEFFDRPPLSSADFAGHETAEYPVEHDEWEHEDPASSAPRPQRNPHDGEDDDVLEETPEFLQDTPDHDRLWFEQRPPRDFKFDG